jgi:GNAT superfamily N-acetyltransferase
LSLEIREEAYDSPNARQLIDALQAEYVERYGGPDDTPVDPAQFAPPHGAFVLGYAAGAAAAMGGLRAHTDGAVEIKRMYVLPEVRGLGYARAVLAALEERARLLGATRVVLETGQRQPEAISLYESSGYERIEGFGHYRDAPLALSYAKRL